MSLRKVLGFACAISLLAGQSLAENGPLLFDGPPPVTPRSAQIRLSVYQQSGKSPFTVQELPPLPVPVPFGETPAVEEEKPVEVDLIPGPAQDPMKAPAGEVRAEPPVPEIPAEAPMPPKEPVEAPAENEGTRESSDLPDNRGKAIESLEAPMPEEPQGASPAEVRPEPREEVESCKPAAPLPTPQEVEPPAPREVQESPHVIMESVPVSSHCNRCSRRRGFSWPCISRADVALPTIPQPYAFGEFGVELGGWLEAGFSAVGTSPADRFNGPVTFNDRHAEGQMNQLWFYLERKPNTWACSLDLGGRIDVMYGTDAQYIQAGDGLEANWDQSERFYQMALPQFYLDATLAGWTVRMGKFFTILGYEGPAAPDNFFYSHAYTMQYGEPFTHTGMLVSRRFGQWLVNGGFHRGNDQFDDTDA